MHAGFVHSIPDGEHLGAFIRRWLCPFAVEIHTGEIGPQMATPRSVGVAIGYDMNAAFFEQFARMRVAHVGEHVERALHPILGLSLARMLARIEPYLHITIAHFEAVDGLAFKAVAEAAIVHALALRRIGDQIVMALHRIRREIGDPDDVAGRRMTDGQCAAILILGVAGIGAPPIIAVFGHAGAVIGPAAGIGAALQPSDSQHQFLATGAGDAEMEPLRKL